MAWNAIDGGRTKNYDLAPEFVDPGQFYESMAETSPERRLLLAMVIDACFVLRNFPEHHKEYRAVVDWMWGKDADITPISFHYLCEVFGWDVITLRLEILSKRPDPGVLRTLPPVQTGFARTSAVLNQTSHRREHWKYYKERKEKARRKREGLT